eukprot:403345364
MDNSGKLQKPQNPTKHQQLIPNDNKFSSPGPGFQHQTNTLNIDKQTINTKNIQRLMQAFHNQNQTQNHQQQQQKNDNTLSAVGQSTQLNDNKSQEKAQFSKNNVNNINYNSFDNNSSSNSKKHTNVNSTANTSGMVTNFTSTTVGSNQGGGAMIVSDFLQSNQNSAVKQYSQERIKRSNNQSNDNTRNGSNSNNMFQNHGSFEPDSSQKLQQTNPFDINQSGQSTAGFNNPSYEKTANFSQSIEHQQINFTNTGTNPEIMQYQLGPVPASLNHNSMIPLINNESFDRMNRQENLQSQTLQKQQIGLKSPLLNIKQKQGDYENIGNTTNSIQGHYISDRIEKTIQKFSKKQIIKNNSPFLNQGNGNKSRNFNQSNSASKIYSSTLKGIANNPKLSQSPYMNNNGGAQGIYNTNLNNKLISNANDSLLNLNNPSLQNNQYNNNSLDQINMLNNSSIPNFEDEEHENDNSRSNMRMQQNQFDKSGDKNITDLSFESLNPINNSFTDGQQNLEFIAITNQKLKLNKLHNMQGQVSIQNKIKKLNNQGYDQSSVQSYAFNPPNYLMNQNFDDNTTTIQQQSFTTNNPHVQWWSQQLQQQQNPASFDEANQLYQLNSQHNQNYPQSAQVSPFQQSKSRDGGYRNIPMRDLSSISDQSPTKPFDLNDPQNPFKGPKLHLFKKGNSRRIKTSSATRNLQPINPLDNSKIAVNFQSIHTGGINTVVNNTHFPAQSAMYYQLNQRTNTAANNMISSGSKDFKNFPLVEQENQYQTIVQTKNKYSSIQQQNSKKNPFGNNLQDSNQSGTIDVYQNESHSYGQYLNRNLQSVNQMRPNTTSFDINQQTSSPKRQQIINLSNVNALEPSHGHQGLSKVQLQEEINGFKHSFYNDRSTPKIQSTKSPNVESARQIEKMKEQILQNSEQIKHIFVLNVGANNGNNNLTSNLQSTQESKAMTPCFLHTPNMTNKWGNFKPNNGDISKDISQQNQQQQLSQSEEQTKNKNSLFVSDKSLKNVLQQKKPQTSHQSKNQSINMGNQRNNYQDDSQRQSNRVLDNIQLGPEDIYLVNGTSNQQSFQQPYNSRNTQNKPSTSNSFRRPLSRNHPIMKMNSQQNQVLSNQNRSQITSDKKIISQGQVNINFSQNQQQNQSQSYIVPSTNIKFSSLKQVTKIPTQTSQQNQNTNNNIQVSNIKIQFSQSKSKSTQNVNHNYDKSSLLIKEQQNEDDN